MTSSVAVLSYALMLYIVIIKVHNSSCEDGVMYSRLYNSGDWKDHYCVYYNPKFHTLGSSKDAAAIYNLTDLSTTHGCNASDYVSASVKNTAVVVKRGSCDFAEKARHAQDAGAETLIIASDELITPGAANLTVDYIEINITVATVLKSSIEKITKQHKQVEILLYAPEISNKFDPNMVIIFLIAVTNIVIGGYWSGITKYEKSMKLRYKHKKESASSKTENDGKEESEAEEEAADDSVDISLPAIVVFFVLVCTFLVLLYFFYDYLVYVVISVFCLAGATGLFSCAQPIWKKIVPFPKKIPANKVPCFRQRPEYRNLALLAICLSIGIFWGIQRHASYAWVLQDILGFAFCINVMNTVNIPNLKICTVLLLLLFVYDIFFVFLTPHLTSNGDSIMVKVATGGNSKTHEQLPMVFKVPHLTANVINVCPMPYSLLGFGDVLVPGLLVAHNHYFDLKVQSRRIYFVCTAIAYAVGLVITFIALAFMETGQPALLYLVPCTLLTTLVIGCVRGEIKLLWSGDQSKPVSKSSSPGHLNSPVNESTGTFGSNSSASSTENENKELLRK